MNLLMTATPIAMDLCRHPFASVAMVIEWHVVGMFAPGFFTGSLIRRFGVLNVILAGGCACPVALCVVIALNGITVTHFLLALALLGVGWNVHVHRRHDALLTDAAYAPAEKSAASQARDEGVRLASGAMVSPTAGMR